MDRFGLKLGSLSGLIGIGVGLTPLRPDPIIGVRG